MDRKQGIKDEYENQNSRNQSANHTFGHQEQRENVPVTSVQEPSAAPPFMNAARERSRVKTLRSAFLELQRALPAVPADTKLSKLDVLVLATAYIAHLRKTLDCQVTSQHGEVTSQQCHIQWNNTLSSHFSGKAASLKGCFHPVKKWPMRSRLYIEMSHHAPIHFPLHSDCDVTGRSQENRVRAAQALTSSWHKRRAPSRRRVMTSEKSSVTKEGDDDLHDKRVKMSQGETWATESKH